MGAQRSSFGKLQRDRDKKAKALAKRERRQERAAAPETVAEDPGPLLGEDGTQLTPAELLQQVEAVHRAFEAGTIDHETFEERKAELLGRLPID
jgi:hypothetical protein